MAREIQSQSGRPQGARTFLGLLANAIFWLVVAIAVPVQGFLEEIPDLAPYAHWAPILFYALAFLSFIRAVRSLQRLATSRMSLSRRPKAAGAAQAERPASTRRARSGSGLPVTRTPTVQRMR
jgi:hypothetical protein